MISVRYMSAAMFLGAFLVTLDQYLNWGKVFELSDIHHELFIITFLFAGFILLAVRKKIIVEE